jgi:hypothetical protein
LDAHFVTRLPPEAFGATLRSHDAAAWLDEFGGPKD